jgi:LCP family protein required for cell wall assembly
MDQAARRYRGGLLAVLLATFGLVMATCGDGSDTADDATTASSTTTVASAAPPDTTAESSPVPPTTSTTIPGSASATTKALTKTESPVTSSAPGPEAWDGEERLNFLLLGSDAGVGRTGTRTDTIILLTVEPETGDMAMFSVPRNLTEAPLPEGMGIWDCNCFPDIITHLWANGEWYPEAFPGPQEPSVNALKAALGLVFDLEIHYYAKVELAGFVAMVDAVGGVTVDVPKKIVDESYPHEDGGREYVVIDEGTQHLDGHLALAYSRIRAHSGDFARMHRQRCVIAALVEQVDISDIVGGYPELTAAIANHVETDIPTHRLRDLVELLSRVDIDRIATLRITRYNYGAGGHAGYQLYALEDIKNDARVLMEDPTTRLDTQDGEGLDAICDESFD